MIYVGENEITNIMIGENEIYGIYAGELQIYPTDFGTVTGITIENLVWVTDIPDSGGTATADNCSFKVYANYDSGKKRNVTTKSNVSGSLVVPATTAETREMVGTLTLTADYEGFTDSATVDVYQSTDYRFLPLTFEILSDGVVKWFVTGGTSYAKTIEYNKNKSGWTSITATSSGVEIPVVEGDTVEFRGDNVKYGNTLDSYYRSAFETTCNYNVYGNIMSMINSTNYSTLTSFASGSGQHFVGMFKDNTHLINAENLCLPAVNLGQETYHMMFMGCTSLTAAPKSVGTSSTTFYFTGVYNYTCRRMFAGCTSLTTAPELPATTLAFTCYENMFYGCTSLTTAPELPATTLNGWCYNKMFDGCSSLNYVKCLATDISASYALADWLSGVSSTGTFVKAAGVSWPSGISGIPNGWTVQEV